MAERNIKISGIGDVTRADFVRAITDPDKFKEFADQQGWGNKRRQLAWNSLHNYAQGVQNGEINEINDMHQIVDDTGARTNKQEKYNWIGSKFDANGATAAFMNQIAKGMQTATKPTDKSLKSIPSVTSYLNQQWFGSNNPDWELFQKNDTLTNGVYGIANRSAKIKEGLTKYKNELTTNGAQYNWDGVDKDALYKNLDAAIASSNVATYAPLGITSDYISNALATKDLSTMVSDSDTNSTQAQAADDPTRGFSEEELARYNTMTPEQQQQYLAQRNAAVNLNNEKFLAQNQADIDKANKEKEDTAFKNWLVANGYYSPKAQASSYVPFRLVQSSMVDSKGKRIKGPATKNAEEWDIATDKNSFGGDEWDNFIHGDLTPDIYKVYSLKNADRHTTNGDVAIRSKLDWLNYNFQLLLDTGEINKLGDDVSSYVGASKGTVWRLKNSKRSSDGTYMYIRKRGNNLEFYRSKSWNDLRNNEYKKHINKHQFGGGIFGGQAKLREQYSKDLKARQDAIKKQQQINSVERTPLRGQRDPNKIKAGQRELGNLGQLTASDYAQLGGITADIASTVSSFFGPAGTVIGAVSGLTGTGAHAFADFTDPSVSKGEAITNLGTNLLFDVAGAVPILGSYGKLAKLGRVGKALQNNAKLYKVILGTVTAPGVIQAAPNAASAVKKLVTNPTTITADELRDLATAISITSGLTKIAPNHNKVRTTNPNYGQNVVVHTNKGKQTISAKDYESIMDKTKNPTMRDRNEALEAATKVKGIQFDNGIFHNYTPSSNNPFKLERFYGKWGIVSRLGNTSDPETKYIFRPAKSVHAFKQGGIIKAQSGIKTGVKVNPKTTWFDAVWSQNVNHILRGLSDNNYYTWLNSMQDKHGDLHKNAGTNFQTTPYNDKSVGDYQNLYKTGYNGEWKDNNAGYNSLGIMHAQNLGRYDLYGNTKRTSGDWNIDANHRYKTDSSYSQITDDRRLLGRKGDFTDEQLASVTEAFKNKGYNFALGKNDYYYLSPIEKSEQNQNTPKKDGSVTNPDIGKKSIFDKGKEYLAKLTSNPGNLYNAVETGKYLLANKATNDIFKIKAPNYVISPKYTSYQVMDNLAQQNAYHNKAAETVNQTSRPLTSSGQLQTAAQQESMNNANKLYLQGNAERNTWLEGQKQQSYKAGLYNMESAVDTANANAQQAYKTRMLNEYQDPRDRARALATNRQNWINALEKFNVIDPYVERKNAQQQYGLAKAQWDYQNDAKVLLAQQKYQQLLRQHQNDLNFNAYDTDEYRALVDAQKEAGARYYNNMYQVYGISNPGFKYKKGGKFEDISKFNTKEFYNTIRHSINTATKQSGDLSKLINTLFKKSNKK